MRKVKVGIIGLGHVAQMCHLPGYRDVEVIEVVAGAELQENILCRVSSDWGFKGYKDYVEMLEKEDLDIACITTGPRHAREITEKAAELGVNVLVEKPMALTLNDAMAMIKKCKKEGVKLCYGETFRFFPTFIRAKKMIDEGALGDLQLLLEIYIGGLGLDNFQPYAIYKEGDPGSGSMGLTDHGIHLVDVFRWLTGSDVEWIFGRGNRAGRPPSTEFLTMKFQNDAIGQLIYNESTFPSDLPYEGIFSWGAYSAGGVSSWELTPCNVRIHGAKGALRIFPYSNKMFIFSEGEQRQIRVQDQPHPAHFGLQIESFAKRLLLGEEPEVTGLDGLKSLQIILAAYESFETKRIISIKPIL
jgi:UDP-N-acetylglucosamine 3-dehydrogenase